MNVTLERPSIVSLLYQQDKDDPDYGSCLWARFYLDLENYTLSIESDCGNYSNGWKPTESETFLQLLSRMGTDYLLGKISSESVVDGDATWESVEAYISDASDYENIHLNATTWEELKDACHISKDSRDIMDAIEDALPSDLWDTLDYDWLRGCIKMDYPVQAKRIVEIFGTCIRLKIIAMSKEAKDAQNRRLNGLLDLMIANPDLPVIPMVDSDVIADDGNMYWMGRWSNALLDEYLTTDNRIYFRGDDDPDRILPKFMDFNDYMKLTDEEADSAYNALPWKKAIIVYIGIPKED